MLIFLCLGVVMVLLGFRGSALAVVGGWGAVLSLYAVLPRLGGSTRLAGIPAEYLPVFGLLAGLAIRAVLNPEVPRLSRLPVDRWPLMVLGTYYLVMLPIASRPSVWLLAVLTVGGQIAAFVLASRSLSALVSEDRSAAQRVFLVGICAFAVIGGLRSVLVPGRHPGDFSATIEFRSSEVIVLLCALPIAAIRWIRSNEWRDLAITGVLAGAILLTFSRTAALGMCGVAVVLVVTSHRSLGVRRFWTRSVVVLVLMSVGLAGLSLVQGEAIATRLRSSIEVISIWTDEELEFGESGGRRRAVQQATIAQIGESPWVGTGPGELLPALDVSVERLRSRSHNLYLSYGAEYGAIGLAALLGVFGTMLRRVVRARRRLTEDQPMSAAPIAVLVPLFAMFLFQEFVSAPYLWMCLTMLLALSGCLDHQPGGQSRSAVAGSASIESPVPIRSSLPDGRAGRVTV